LKTLTVLVLGAFLFVMPACGDTLSCTLVLTVIGFEDGWPILQAQQICTLVIDARPGPIPGGGGGSPPPPPPPPPPGSGSGGSPIIAPTVTFEFINTSDPYNPLVALAVNSPDASYPPTSVELRIDNVMVGSLPGAGSGRYQFAIAPIGTFAERTHTFLGIACTSASVCGQGQAMMTRFTPSPLEASNQMTAVWYEPDLDEMPLARQAVYGHVLRQVYIKTTFSANEVGANAYAQLMGTSVSVGGHPPPLWNASVLFQGTTARYSGYMGMNACLNPFCTEGCSSRCVTSGAFGYAPQIQDWVSGFVVEGESALITNSYLSLWVR